MTVERMLGEIDSHELTEWEAYETIEPIGDQRLDFLAGQICAAIFNVNKKPDTAPYTAARCMAEWREPEPPEEPDREALGAQIKSGMMAFVRSQNSPPTT